jgi:hypothetical protein
MHDTVIQHSVSALMWLLLAAAVPLGADGQTWAQWGLAGLLVGYTQWRDWRREEQMRAARESDHNWAREKMLPALERCSAVIEQCTRQLDRCGRPA